ncbi:hypothetical protein N657DRAFT_672552 [Parathielavia appendiculata]|uniref:Ecp2 effector protein-like domain-containing protein n=1 Tax=Parathielavia appendiculata TaxID=2587402 RepID=A0AAN6TY04_9PEZI|nr:hypothetical protein N657DRAFT_672552 [Parathielavia appendiculata]
MKSTTLTTFLLAGAVRALALPTSTRPEAETRNMLTKRAAYCTANSIQDTTTPSSALAADCLALASTTLPSSLPFPWTPTEENNHTLDATQGTCGFRAQYLSANGTLDARQVVLGPAQLGGIIEIAVERYATTSSEAGEAESRVGAEGTVICIAAGMVSKAGFVGFEIYLAPDAGARGVIHDHVKRAAAARIARQYRGIGAAAAHAHVGVRVAWHVLALGAAREVALRHAVRLEASCCCCKREDEGGGSGGFNFSLIKLADARGPGHHASPSKWTHAGLHQLAPGNEVHYDGALPDRYYRALHAGQTYTLLYPGAEMKARHVLPPSEVRKLPALKIPGGARITFTVRAEETNAHKSNTLKSVFDIKLKVIYTGEICGPDCYPAPETMTRPITFRNWAILAGLDSSLGDAVSIYRRPGGSSEMPWEGCDLDDGTAGFQIYDLPDEAVRVIQHDHFTTLRPGESWTTTRRLQGER